jgi:hypothetical protein
MRVVMLIGTFSFTGHFNNLYMELREDPHHFYKYTRMSLPQFDQLKEIVEPHMPVKDKVRHKPMPTEMRLVITLRQVFKM